MKFYCILVFSIIASKANATHYEGHSWLWEVLDFWFPSLGVHVITLIFGIYFLFGWLSERTFSSFFVMIYMTILCAIVFEGLLYLFSAL